MARMFWWVVLIASGFVGVLLALILDKSSTAWIVAIAWGGIAIAFGATTSWYDGIRRHVKDHLGPRWQVGEVIRHRTRTAERVNLQLALDWLQAQSNTLGPFGIRHIVGGEEEEGGYIPSPAEVVALIEGNPAPAAIIWEPMPTSVEETMHCASNALYLLRISNIPVVVLVQGRSSQGSKRVLVQLLAQNQDSARAALAELLRLANEQSPYRGQVISLQRPKGQSNDVAVQFHSLGEVRRDDIVLPGEVLHIVERNILGVFRHAEALRRAGQGARHGVLLHGPPGTGKTLVTRWIASNVGATVFLVAGRQYALLRATCQLARLLAPSLVILEDIDLIAADRRRNVHTPLLHELLDEMDGLAVSTEIVFLLTTNRPEVLEQALAGRPGRVDQAIFFPLPDLECRRRLFACFSAGVDVSQVKFAPLLARTEGASPAFVKEVFRRATLIAVERGEKADPLTLTGEDFEHALRELIEAGGPLTRAFLGFPHLPGAG